MRQGHTQNNTQLSLRTALGPDVLLLDAFQGCEGLSQLFSFTLTMRASSSEIDGGQLIGQAASVTVSIEGNSAQRHFHGIISRFVYLGSHTDFAMYTAELVPSAWLLTRGRDRAIYQNMTVPQIVQSVLNAAHIGCRQELSGSYAPREYCVRYDETAFDFISRLLEDEGIFYFFAHDKSSHALVLADSNAVFMACLHAESLTVLGGMDSHPTTQTVQHIELDARLVLQSQVVDDYHFLTPSTSLLAQVDAGQHSGVDYEFPGHHTSVSQGEVRARIRTQEQQTGQLVARGQSHNPYLRPGTTFALRDHPRGPLNGDHILRQVSHHADAQGYHNRFETVSPQLPFRPQRTVAQPVVAGNHVAQVVGAEGEEVWTDEFGRIKVRFPWDRQERKNDKSSCWIRVSQIWAGQGWGALFLPRVGQEVVVSYIDGDPDRPLVTGSVYNAQQMPPVDLPAKSSHSTILSRSTKKGAAGNELRFDDSKDAEQLYLHAQKDMGVEVENDLLTTVIAGNEVHTIQQGDRGIHVAQGNEVHTVQGTRELAITGAEKHVNEAGFAQQVAGDYELKISGNLVIDVTGTVTIKSAQSMTSQAGSNITHKAGSNLVNDAGVMLTQRGGVGLSQEAPKIDSKASGLHSVESGGLLAFKGSLVKIN